MTDESPLLLISPTPGRASALVCLPQAGAGVASFTSLARALGERASVWAACLPGREKRLMEPPLTSIDAMADALLGPALDIETKRMTLFGHCGGALIAFELAHRLTGKGRPPANLIVSSQVPPSSAANSSATSPAVADLPLPDLINYLRELGGTAPALLDSQPLMRLMAPGIRADLAAVEQYRPPARRSPLGIPIIAIAGHDDSISRADLRDWATHTTGSLSVHQVGTGHFYLTENESDVVSLLLPHL